MPATALPRGRALRGGSTTRCTIRAAAVDVADVRRQQLLVQKLLS